MTPRRSGQHRLEPGPGPRHGRAGEARVLQPGLCFPSSKMLVKLARSQRTEDAFCECSRSQDKMTVNFSRNYGHAVKVSFGILPLIYRAVRSLRFRPWGVRTPCPQQAESRTQLQKDRVTRSGGERYRPRRRES